MHFDRSHLPATFEVGQTVYLYEGRRYGGHEEVTVTKVARKNITIERHGRERTFSMETGMDTRNSIGQADCVLTHEQVEYKARHQLAAKRLQDVGIEHRAGFGFHRFTAETLEAMAELAENDLNGA